MRITSTLLKLFYVAVLLFATKTVLCKHNLGTPFISNYEKEHYQAGTQTWDIKQNKLGVLYFANNAGLLEFDGTNWRTYPLANRTVARSLAIDKGGRIYIGAQGEFGYFEGNSIGVLTYYSLLELIPKELRDFDDVWDTEIFEEVIFFRSAGKIYSIKDQKFKLHELGEEVDILSQSNGRLFAVSKKDGLYEYKNGQFQLIAKMSTLENMQVTSILNIDESTILLTTLKNGVFQYTDNRLSPWRTSANQFLKDNRIYSGVVLPGKEIALGTSLNGLLILNQNGLPTYHFSKKNGLQNNNILTLQSDHAGNIWAGLNNGIDYLEISTPYSNIYPDGDLEGTTYASIIFDDKIYLGTSSGLYVADWTSYYDPFSTKRFKLVEGTDGQVWGLTTFEGELIAGHHEGTFVIQNDQSTRISDINGAWTFVPLENHPGYLVGGTYSGLVLYQKTSTGLEFVRKLPGFTESSRIMAVEKDGSLWITHPYRGAYKLKLSSDLKGIEQVKFYNSDHGFPSNLYIHVFNVGDELFFTAEKNVYRFLNKEDRFEKVSSYSALFGEEVMVKRLIPDDLGNIWYVVDEKVGLLTIKAKGLEFEITNRQFPKLFNQLVGGFEYIYPYGKEDVFFGTEKGFIFYNKEKVVSTAPPTVLIRNVQLIAPVDSILLGGQVNGEPSKNKLHHSLNAVQFSFSAPDFSNVIEYSYRLQGLDDNWSSWSTKTEKEYTNLSPGDYQFSIRARHPYQTPGEEASYQFSINSPWYRTWIAYLFYFLIAGYLGYRWIRKTQENFEQEKELILSTQEEILEEKERTYRQAVERSEKEIIKLKNEKLETEINHQNEELAALTMHFVQKNEILGKLKEELVSLTGKSSEPGTRKDIKRLIRLLDTDARMDEDWPRFTYYFDRVHSDFTKKLWAIHPNLTQKDIKLCVFLRMNLSTKEIAPLLNISIRGVEISRYRLRKKLGLDSKVRLGDYLLEI